MSDTPEKREVVRQWLARAHDDLRAATYLLNLADCPFWTVAFHAQQGGEKLLKALLSWLSLPFARTHDIGELIALLPVERRPGVPIDAQSKLTEYAVAGRYPGEDQIGPEEAREALAIARAIAEAVEKQLPPEVGREE